MYFSDAFAGDIDVAAVVLSAVWEGEGGRESLLDVESEFVLSGWALDPGLLRGFCQWHSYHPRQYTIRT